MRGCLGIHVEFFPVVSTLEVTTVPDRLSLEVIWGCDDALANHLPRMRVMPLMPGSGHGVPFSTSSVRSAIRTSEIVPWGGPPVRLAITLAASLVGPPILIQSVASIMELMESNSVDNKTATKAAGSTRTSKGVDTTLLKWMASNTPEQRLQILQSNVAAIVRARNARRRP